MPHFATRVTLAFYRSSCYTVYDCAYFVRKRGETVAYNIDERLPKGRTAAVIRLSALAKNAALLQERVGNNCELMAVLKGDAYGHGIAGVYPTLKAAGIRRFAVAVWEEGAALRACGCGDPILILGDTCDGDLPHLLEHRLTPTVFAVETAQKLNALAEKAHTVHPVHIKIDTGLSRIGFPCCEETVDAVKAIASLPHLRIAGAFTHFAKADEPNGEEALGQLSKFLAVTDKLEAAGVAIPMKHASNSPAVLLRPEAQLDAVRVGDVLFGLCPVDNDLWEKEPFEEVMAWYTRVSFVKTVPVGTQVGYGGTFTTTRESVLATVPVGFADGYSRRLSNCGYVMIRGQKAPIVGRVCMDQFVVDVTDIADVSRRDRVTLLDEDVSILHTADLIGANVDEIVCAVSKRVPRVYI